MLAQIYGPHVMVVDGQPLLLDDAHHHHGPDHDHDHDIVPDLVDQQRSGR
jgi:hypothetical protein